MDEELRNLKRESYLILDEDYNDYDPTLFY